MLDRFEELRVRDRANREKTKQDFLDNVDVIHNNTSNIVMPMVEVVKEGKSNFIAYHITKYPMCLVYSISMYNKDSRQIYYTKEFYKNTITKKYQKEFEELEKYFK